MKRTACLASLLVLSACASMAPDDCDLQFRGQARKLVKLRAPSLAAQYQPVGTDAQPATVSSILAMGCELQPHLPEAIPENDALDVEKRVVTLQGFLMAVRFEHLAALPFQDQDFHIQLSDSSDWNASRHIIIEVPPGQPYCDARKAIWQLVKNEDPSAGRTHIFRNPPRVKVVGFLFFDGTHAQGNDCNSSGGRGISDGNHPNMVQGVWELHPVIAAR